LVLELPQAFSDILSINSGGVWMTTVLQNHQNIRSGGAGDIISIMESYVNKCYNGSIIACMAISVTAAVDLVSVLMQHKRMLVVSLSQTMSVGMAALLYKLKSGEMFCELYLSGDLLDKHPFIACRAWPFSCAAISSSIGLMQHWLASLEEQLIRKVRRLWLMQSAA
jgi:hypothetical protein